MEAEAEILIPFELQFSDLLFLSSSSSRVSPPCSPKEQERLDSIANSVMETLGPSGPGLLSVAGVPRAGELRRSLLPLARKLALLGNKDRARVLKDHGLGSDVSLKNPDRTVSSFALQLKYEREQGLDLSFSGPSNTEEESSFVEKSPPVCDIDEVKEQLDHDFKKLGSTFKELGQCMMELGLRLARVCDKAIGSRELEQSIMESSSAKGRLIHYHSKLDNLILKGTSKRTKASAKKLVQVSLNPPLSCEPRASANMILPESRVGVHDEQTQVEILHATNRPIEPKSWRNSLSKLWQQWHYDYGIFTVLTAPLFILSMEEDSNGVPNSQECSSPDGHTYLQLYDSNKNKIYVVKSSPESFIVQVGEAADILSNGKLRSTLHSVGRPVLFENITRETFVVFLQPAWGKKLSYSPHLLSSETIRKNLASSDGKTSEGPHHLMQEIIKQIPPLSSRLKDGMTFEEFSRETTKQYYGGSGTQSRR